MIEVMVLIIGSVFCGVVFGYVKWVVMPKNLKKDVDSIVEKIKDGGRVRNPSLHEIHRTVWIDDTETTWPADYVNVNSVIGTIPKPKPVVNSWIHENKRQPKWAKR